MTEDYWPIRSVELDNNHIFNTGEISFGFSNAASPGSSFYVGAVSGTTLQMPWSATTSNIATIGTVTGTATTGVYPGTALTATSGTGTGAVGTVTVVGGTVTAVAITGAGATPGINFAVGDTLSFTVTGGSGTAAVATIKYTSAAIAHRIDYGISFTDATEGCTGVVTGIYLTGGNTLNITQTGCSAPAAYDLINFYDVMNISDGGGNVIVGTQVPFWRGPPAPVHARRANPATSACAWLPRTVERCTAAPRRTTRPSAPSPSSDQ